MRQGRDLNGNTVLFQRSLEAFIVTLFFALLITVIGWALGWGMLIEQGVGGKPIGWLIGLVLQHRLHTIAVVVCCWISCLYLVAWRQTALGLIGVCCVLLTTVVLMSVLLMQLRGAIELTLFAFGFRYFE